MNLKANPTQNFLRNTHALFAAYLNWKSHDKIHPSFNSAFNTEMAGWCIYPGLAAADSLPQVFILKLLENQQIRQNMGAFL